MGVILTPSMDGKVKRRTDSTIFPETAESWRSILWGIIWPPKNTRVTWTGSMLKGNVIFQHQFLGDVLVFKGGVFDFDINYKGIFSFIKMFIQGYGLGYVFCVIFVLPILHQHLGNMFRFLSKERIQWYWRVGIPNTPGGDVYTNVTIFGCRVFVLKKRGHQFRVRSKKQANDCMVMCAGIFSSLRWCHETFMTPIKSKPVSIGGLVSLRPSWSSKRNHGKTLDLLRWKSYPAELQASCHPVWGFRAKKKTSFKLESGGSRPLSQKP